MKLNKKISKILKSSVSKKLFFAAGGLLILFFLFNDLFMYWYVNKEATSIVPNVVGLKYDEAVRLLDSLRFEPRKGDVRLDREHPADVVIVQNPPVGMKVKTGRRVYMTVSAGEITVIVPNIRGKTLRDARFQLEREGLRIGNIDYETSDEYPAGTVISQKIESGVKVKRDITVSCVVSIGSEDNLIQIPDLTGKTLADAEKLLKDSGLLVGNVTYISSNDLLPNTVIDQYPRLGEKALPDKKVDLIVVQSSDNDNAREY
ncbi:MAG: PASTA domain-containing protein [Ignavibacteriales bacterium]|nr:PASTA domain-containing protein [Ignavibacteriales bacterium]